MAQSRLQPFADCWRGRQPKQPGESRSAAYRCTNVLTVQTTLVVVLFLVGGVLLLDSYKWRRISFPWSSGFSEGPYEVLTQESALEPPPATRGTPNLDAVHGEAPDGMSMDFTTPEVKQSPPPSVPTQAAPPPPELRSPPASISFPPTELQSPSMSETPEVSLDKVPYPPPPSAQITKKKPVLKTALDKLEYGLAQARFAIRRACQNGTQMDNKGQGNYEPYGDVYRNAAAFRQSYREMERRFKVYVYSEGEEPLVHNGPCKEIYAIEGRFIQEMQGNYNPFLTTDPDKAHVYFLPFSVAMMVTYLYEKETGDMEPLRLFVWDYVDVLRHKYSFWNRSGGADHFMLSCHDWGPAITRSNIDLGTRAIRVLCNANTSEGYVPWKDASLPEINLVGGHIPAELGGPPAKDRPHLAFFAGRDHGPVRPQLFKYWEGKDDDVIVYQWLPENLDYHKLMKTSRFCICPGGYEVNSPRIVEAIYNECVPVIIADSFVLPFSDVLNWEAFSLHVKESDIPNLKIILQNVTMENYTTMQKKVSQVQRHFLLHQPPERYDVLHMILHSVWLRRLNIRVGFS
ncbi:hypothetical protein M758_11G126000 [Ceratodon purpureus]|nr:hypothetical protein M758_11G126000 [Ceratodon purpureus]KAG0601614.1 hypothetical protein M758_11G126000 [Ceratodon purpureus]KAG0601615.1 hypothetical protein M758_11G126000 [Ceratodon purpureus]